jgi:hypothetical protein
MAKGRPMSTVNVACGSARRVLGEAPVVCNRERGHAGEHCCDAVGNRTWWPQDVRAEEAVVDERARHAPPVAPIRRDLDAMAVRVAALEAARPAIDEPSVAALVARVKNLSADNNGLAAALAELERQRDGALVERDQYLKHSEYLGGELAKALARIRALEGSAAERCRAEAELRRVRPVLEALQGWLRFEVCRERLFDHTRVAVLYDAASAYFDGGL